LRPDPRADAGPPPWRLAGGRPRGIENKTDPGPELKGTLTRPEGRGLPLRKEAVALWEKSDFAKQAFGDAVHKHYLNYGQLEQGLFDKVVTDYERRRMFERG
jgi:glutamine synthetase